MLDKYANKKKELPPNFAEDILYNEIDLEMCEELNINVVTNLIELYTVCIL
jgi:hypothetical protein